MGSRQAALSPLATGQPGPPGPQGAHHTKCRPIALRDLPDEIRQSVSSLYSAPGVEATETSPVDERQLANIGVVVKETRRSWLMLLVAFLFQCLYGLGLFAPPVYYVTYMEVFGISKSAGAWVSAIYVFSCFVIGRKLHVIPICCLKLIKWFTATVSMKPLYWTN